MPGAPGCRSRRAPLFSAASAASGGCPGLGRGARPLGGLEGGILMPEAPLASLWPRLSNERKMVGVGVVSICIKGNRRREGVGRIVALCEPECHPPPSARVKLRQGGGCPALGGGCSPECRSARRSAGALLM